MSVSVKKKGWNSKQILKTLLDIEVNDVDYFVNTFADLPVAPTNIVWTTILAKVESSTGLLFAKKKAWFYEFINSKWRFKSVWYNIPQVTTAEKDAWTLEDVRRFSPKDVSDMVWVKGGKFLPRESDSWTAHNALSSNFSFGTQEKNFLKYPNPEDNVAWATVIKTSASNLMTRFTVATDVPTEVDWLDVINYYNSDDWDTTNDIWIRVVRVYAYISSNWMKDFGGHTSDNNLKMVWTFEIPKATAIDDVHHITFPQSFKTDRIAIDVYTTWGNTDHHWVRSIVARRTNIGLPYDKDAFPDRRSLHSKNDIENIIEMTPIPWYEWSSQTEIDFETRAIRKILTRSRDNFYTWWTHFSSVTFEGAKLAEEWEVTIYDTDEGGGTLVHFDKDILPADIVFNSAYWSCTMDEVYGAFKTNRTYNRLEVVSHNWQHYIADADNISWTFTASEWKLVWDTSTSFIVPSWDTVFIKSMNTFFVKKIQITFGSGVAMWSRDVDWPARTRFAMPKTQHVRESLDRITGLMDTNIYPYKYESFPDNYMWTDALYRRIVSPSWNSAENFYIGSNIYKKDDTDTYINFSPDALSFYTNGAKRMSVSNTGFKLASGSSITSISNTGKMTGSSQSAISTQHEIKGYIRSKIPDKLSIAYAGRFDGSSSMVLLNDWYVKIRFNDKQFQFYVDSNYSGRADAGIVHSKTSTIADWDDITAAKGAYHYFTNGWTKKTAYDASSYGVTWTCHVTPESSSSTTPSYRIEYQVGNATSITAIIYKIEK